MYYTCRALLLLLSLTPIFAWPTCVWGRAQARSELIGRARDGSLRTARPRRPRNARSTLIRPQRAPLHSVCATSCTCMCAMGDRVQL